MTDFKVNGLVIRESDHKDNDKILTVLTEKYGKLFVIGKGVKSLKNRHMACTQLFAYASFNLRKRGNFYYITDFNIIRCLCLSAVNANVFSITGIVSNGSSLYNSCYL